MKFELHRCAVMQKSHRQKAANKRTLTLRDTNRAQWLSVAESTLSHSLPYHSHREEFTTAAAVKQSTC